MDFRFRCAAPVARVRTRVRPFVRTFTLNTLCYHMRTGLTALQACADVLTERMFGSAAAVVATHPKYRQRTLLLRTLVSACVCGLGWLWLGVWGVVLWVDGGVGGWAGGRCGSRCGR
jgi:hypothetical protein